MNYDKMKYSLNERLKTFENHWPVSSPEPLVLAQARFFYLGFEDKVQCPFYNGIVSDWEINDDPEKKHKRLFPWCEFLSCDTKRDNMNEKYLSESKDVCGNMKESNLNEASREHLNIETLGVRLFKSPVHPQQASIDARLRSFSSWSDDSPVSKEALAKAGFFYTGVQDITKCFNCDVELCDWNKSDDPLVEHARWNCDCNFLQLTKGDEFINGSLQKYCPSSVKRVPPEEITQSCSKPLMVKIDEAMKLDIVKYVLDSDLCPPYIVRIAVLRQIEETGSSFTDINDLCSAVNYLKSKLEKIPINEEESLNFKINVRKCSSDKVENKYSSENPIENSSVRNLSSTVKENLDKSTLNNEDNKTIEDRRLCQICMDKEIGVILLPCGHLVSCTECVTALELCPMCRKLIKATIKAYLP